MPQNQEDEKLSKSELLPYMTEIVASHLSQNSIPTSDVTALMKDVYTTLEELGTSSQNNRKIALPMPIQDTIMPDYIICLEDGKKLKMLKRHLKTAYDMTPEEYREKWGLPFDYPMVAPNYAKKRSDLAKEIGLGTNQTDI